MRLEVGGAWVASGEISGYVSHHRRTNVKQSLNFNCSALHVVCLVHCQWSRYVLSTLQ